ncbi:hypothetical protein [Nitrospirillum sp. BR 11828]|uniref:hypothetical protein n=1 Tax=Nitrospirillum sp. BR 11828 TaxID=3104325 RepID=UPI002ACA9A52|nr:hypothetical protein [Nitrospirillum sp. BR 11828]MDZ5648530.1 hypothetical protein [Nitrospirillum sp. BR 11828]
MIMIPPPPVLDLSPAHPPAASLHVDRVDAVQEREARQRDRRRRPPAEAGQRHGRSLFDDIVDEADPTGALEPHHEERLRQNLRGLVRSGAPVAPPAPGQELAHVVEHLAPQHAELSDAERLENARLADALRQCLAVHSDGARKIASYLEALLAQNGEIHHVELTV